MQIDLFAFFLKKRRLPTKYIFDYKCGFTSVFHRLNMGPRLANLKLNEDIMVAFWKLNVGHRPAFLNPNADLKFAFQ